MLANRQPAARAARRSRQCRRPLHQQSLGRRGTGGGRSLAVESGGDVLLIGTGLTMVDMVLSLERGRASGRIVALSRRGPDPAGACGFHAGAGRARGRAARQCAGAVALAAAARRRGRLARGGRFAPAAQPVRCGRAWTPASSGGSCAMRGRGGTSTATASRPRSRGRSRELVAEGRLEIVAGRIGRDAGGRRGDRGRVSAGAARRGSRRRRFAFAFNCTGPLGAIERTRDPLLKRHARRRAGPADQLGIGLDVDERSRVAGSERLWALGPLTKGRYWEIVAVPDIREQAAAVAEDIAMELGR